MHQTTDMFTYVCQRCIRSSRISQRDLREIGRIAQIVGDLTTWERDKRHFTKSSTSKSLQRIIIYGSLTKQRVYVYTYV